MKRMFDPERILRASGSGDASERALLSCLQLVAVPPRAKADAWAGLATAGLEAASFGALPANTSLWQGVLKALASTKALFAVPAVTTAVTVGVLTWHAPSAPVDSAVPASVPGFALVPAGAAVPAPVDSAALAPESAEPTAAAAPTALPTEDRLARESAQLTRARAELRAGNAAAARARLFRMQRELGPGALDQEREVLAIEALAAQGKAAPAERLARAFVATHPESPHVKSLRHFILAP